MLEQCLAAIILGVVSWSRLYQAYREFGHQSLFGESALIELSPLQSKLLSLTHFYDVVRSIPEADELIPEAVLPFPTELQAWYNTWKDEQKSGTDSDSSNKKNAARKKAKKKPAYEDDLQALSASVATP